MPNSVSVNLTPASQTSQTYGSSEVSAPGTGGGGEPGRATFNNVTKDGPHTHKATNVGPTPFHNISFILKDRGPAGTTVAGTTVSDRSGIRGYTQIMDNARLRAWRVVLKPGEATGQITQTAPGLRVYIRGGVLAETVPGSADRGMAPYEGDFIWQDAGQTQDGEEHGDHAGRIRRIRTEIEPVSERLDGRPDAVFTPVGVQPESPPRSLPPYPRHRQPERHRQHLRRVVVAGAAAARGVLDDGVGGHRPELGDLPGAGEAGEGVEASRRPEAHRDRLLENLDLEIALDRLPAHHHHRERGAAPLSSAPLAGAKVYFSIGL